MAAGNGSEILPAKLAVPEVVPRALPRRELRDELWSLTDLPVALVTGPAGSGKTQLAASSAEWLWHSGKVDLLVWAAATSRASVLSAYVEAAVKATGADPAGDAETVAGRFLSWLAETGQAWVVVLDDLSSPADLEGLRPDGPAGRVLITTRNATAVPADQRPLILQVGAFSPREALSYLMGRLTADPDQRLGAIDLVQDLGYDPMALAQASAVIASSVLSCRDYRDYFQRHGGEGYLGVFGPANSELKLTLSSENHCEAWAWS